MSWELWSNSNDECGLVCEQQRKFIKAFKAAGKALMVKGLVSFEPHYLLWTCDGSADSKEECASQCIRGGAYCCPDPDDDIHEGYSGADVLRVRGFVLRARAVGARASSTCGVECGRTPCGGVGPLTPRAIRSPTARPRR